MPYEGWSDDQTLLAELDKAWYAAQ